MLRTPTTYLLPVTVISPANMGRSDDDIRAAQLAFVFANRRSCYRVVNVRLVKNWSTFIFMIMELPCPLPHTARIRTVIIKTPY
mgnify:CR=1 FL=1